MEEQKTFGHLAALLTVVVWGTTFISTKVLLDYFQPIEILFFRFILGLPILYLICPKPLKGTTAKQEMLFALAGLMGITVYYLVENIALTYTMATNVGVIASTTPFFTAIIDYFLPNSKHKIHPLFLIGFVLAVAGVCFISFNGASLKLNPLGDFLALLAAFIWAAYSVLIRKISSFGYSNILVTRRIFLYGILFMIPALFIFDFHVELSQFQNPVAFWNLIYLGLGASTICFLTWNYGVKILGAVKTSVYLYLVPVVAVICSALVLHERITLLSAIGTVLTLSGLVLSEYKKRSPVRA